MSIFKKKEYSSTPLETVQDPQTGETVHRVSVDTELIQNIENTMKAHGGTMNEFVQNSVGFFDLLERQLELKKKIKIADEKVKESMTEAMKRSKLDMKKPYAFNIQLKCFEWRSPPIVQGMSQSEIEKSQNPGIPPTILKKEGIVG